MNFIILKDTVIIWNTKFNCIFFYLIVLSTHKANKEQDVLIQVSLF